MLLTKILSIFSCLCLSISLQAATCSLNNATDLSGALMPMNGIIGQQFIACETGTINSITVNTSGGDVHLYLAAGNGSTITAGDIFESFPSQSGGVITLQLSKPFPVQEKMQYAFGIMGPTMVRLDAMPTGLPANTTDADGLFLFGIDGGGTFSEVEVSDLFFALTIEFTPIELASVELTSIPTMSEWGMLIFGLLVLNMALFFIRRKAFIALSPASINR